MGPDLEDDGLTSRLHAGAGPGPPPLGGRRADTRGSGKQRRSRKGPRSRPPHGEGSCPLRVEPREAAVNRGHRAGVLAPAVTFFTFSAVKWVVMLNATSFSSLISNIL